MSTLHEPPAPTVATKPRPDAADGGDEPLGGAVRGSGAAGVHYADTHAADYDRWFGKPGVTGATVDTLAALAGTGPVLELGIGTGRVALPLTGRGFDVHGVEASEAMAARLRSKPGGERVRVTPGDFAEVPAAGMFSLLYCVGGTFFELPGREAQQRCLTAAAARLAPGGVFVLDAHVPEALAVAAASGVPEVVSETDEHLILCHRSIDPSTSTYQSHYLIHEADRTRHLRVRFHYVSPGELDLMAERAGLRPRQRLGSWAGEAFSRSSTYHVSVYEHR
ncbi:class I SAM-dependent DNA methyltransferase [Streptomyces sp. NBC_01477]|uniref:class I SAM-dependent DNA methyltransferase n=1 Tax=Streptomyces sp. NBC_01477 TaxID=2976015 RepID=UPI002E32F3AB|nr:class I SAM-dependent methyltransferase [Streptomyces sp. NBC_01477]